MAWGRQEEKGELEGRGKDRELVGGEGNEGEVERVGGGLEGIKEMRLVSEDEETRRMEGSRG